MHHLDARSQTALAREHAERLRSMMQAGRRPTKPNVDQDRAVCKETRPLLGCAGAVRRTAL